MSLEQTRFRQSRKTISKDELALRILSWYFEKGTIPTFKDFKMGSIYCRNFGNWSGALKYCGLDLVKESPKKHTNTWQRQKDRHTKLKADLVDMLGGCCQSCGYNKNYSALQFHHKDPAKKTMKLDARALGNHSLERIFKELEGCELLCANCHLEHHNPQLKVGPRAVS